MKFALVVLSAITAAWAQMTVNTPVGAISCLNQQVTWTGGTGPFTLQVQPGGDTSAAALNTYPTISGSPYIWLVEQAANTQVFLRLRDSTGLTAETGIFTIQTGGPPTCSPSTASTTAAGTGTSTPQTPATSTPAGTTPVTTPPATTSGGSTPASSSSRTTSAAATSSSGAALGSAKIAGGVVGLVGVVAAVLA